MVLFTVYDGRSGRKLEAELDCPNASVLQLRQALQREGAPAGDAILLVTDCRDSAPVLLQDCAQLCDYNLPHDEKEVFAFFSREVPAGTDEEPAWLGSSFSSTKGGTKSFDGASSLPDSEVAARVQGGNPLIPCLISAGKKLEKQGALAKGVFAKIEAKLAALRQGLEMVLVQDRASEALAAYCEVRREKSGVSSDDEDGAWIAEAHERLTQARIALENIRYVGVNPAGGDAALAACLAMDGVRECKDLVVELDECEVLVKDAEEMLGPESPHCAVGEHIPIGQAKRFSHSLDTESKIRVTLETMRENCRSADTKISTVRAAEAEVACLCTQTLANVNNLAEECTNKRVQDDALLRAVQETMEATKVAEKHLNAMHDVEGDLESRRKAFAVQRDEWRRLVGHNIRDSLSSILPLRGEEAKARASLVLKQLDAGVAKCEQRAADVRRVWNALRDELGRRTAFRQWRSARKEAVERMCAEASKKEAADREAFVSEHAEWLRGMGLERLLCALRESSVPACVTACVVGEQDRWGLPDVDDAAAQFEGSTCVCGAEERSLEQAHRDAGGQAVVEASSNGDYSCLSLSEFHGPDEGRLKGLEATVLALQQQLDAARLEAQAHKDRGVVLAQELEVARHEAGMCKERSEIAAHTQACGEEAVRRGCEGLLAQGEALVKVMLALRRGTEEKMGALSSAIVEMRGEVKDAEVRGRERERMAKEKERELVAQLETRNRQLAREVEELQSSLSQSVQPHESAPNTHNSSPVQEHVAELMTMLSGLADSTNADPTPEGEVMRLKGNLRRAASILSYLCAELDDLEKSTQGGSSESAEAAPLVSSCLMHAEDLRLILGLPEPAVSLRRKNSQKTSPRAGAHKDESSAVERLRNLEGKLAALVEGVNRCPQAREVLRSPG